MTNDNYAKVFGILGKLCFGYDLAAAQLVAASTILANLQDEVATGFPESNPANQTLRPYYSRLDAAIRNGPTYALASNQGAAGRFLVSDYFVSKLITVPINRNLAASVLEAFQTEMSAAVDNKTLTDLSDTGLVHFFDSFLLAPGTWNTAPDASADYKDSVFVGVPPTIISVVGTPGVDGTNVLHGSGAPSSGVGTNGDFYIDIDVWDIYGPKAGGAWPGSPVSLVGPTGLTGTSIRSGSGAPSGGLGNDGDFYIDTAVSDLYGPKTGGSWGSPVSLIGATGATGATGAPGVDGATWRSGTGAPSSGLGVDGDFYFRIDTNDVYKKTAGTYSIVANIRGSTGATGAPGLDGATWRSGSGAPSSGLGVDGDFYFRTDTDDVYKKTSGTYSIVANIKGSTGATGAPGADGRTILNGTGVPSGGLGNDGDFYIRTTTEEIYGPKTAGSWGGPTSLIGQTKASYFWQSETPAVTGTHKRFYSDRAGTINWCRGEVVNGDGTATANFDVKKNGSTIFPSATKPSVSAGQYIGTERVPDVTSFIKGDYFEVVIIDTGGATKLRMTINFNY
jgi:hypothetical protein